MLSDPLIHYDESRLQVLNSDNALTADHWIWARRVARQVDALFYSTTMLPHGRGHPDACSKGYRGIPLTDGYEA